MQLSVLYFTELKLCRISDPQSQGRMNSWLPSPHWVKAIDKLHGGVCLTNTVSNKSPQPQASMPTPEDGCDGWMDGELLPHHTHSIPPGSQNAPTLPIADPGDFVSQTNSKSLNKTPPKHFHTTAVEQDKTHSEIKTFTFNPKNILLLVFF